jgi:hypothetical protein
MHRVSKKKKEHTWEIRRLTASPAAFVGLVEAPDEAKAKEHKADTPRSSRR